MRVCETPGSMVVESSFLGSSALYIYVPATTGAFKLAVFDQMDNTPVMSPSTFLLIAPDNTELRLDHPERESWSEYEIEVKGRWGVWQLRVIAPEAPPPGGREVSARNEFMVRTIGQVDLYARPGPGVSYRGVLAFTKSKLDADQPHTYSVQVPAVQRLRINLRLPSEPVPPGRARAIDVDLEPPDGIEAEQRWVAMERARFYRLEFWRMEYLEASGNNLQGLWPLTLSNVEDLYRIGTEQQLRLFFTDSPLMPMPVRTEVSTLIDQTHEGVPARLEVTSPQTAREWYSGFTGSEEPDLAFTSRDGRGAVSLQPGIAYQIKAARGIEFDDGSAAIAAGDERVTLPLRQRLARRSGWFCGDNHLHSVYSDGTHTPAQMVAGALGEGLDWITLTDHGAGPDITHVFRAHEEGQLAAERSGLVVIPGEEFSAEDYHATIINGTVRNRSTADLREVIDAALEASTSDRPVLVKWNHPWKSGWEELASRLDRLPLIELWNSPEPETTNLWWDLLNKGMRVFADASTDSHHLGDTPIGYTGPFGSRRTYAYLGGTTPSVANIVRALGAGRSFLSRGALVYFTVNGEMPGSTITVEGVSVSVQVESASPVGRIEIVHNGESAHSFDVGGQLKFAGEAVLQTGAGWYLAQVLPDNRANPPLAITNPVFTRS